MATEAAPPPPPNDAAAAPQPAAQPATHSASPVVPTTRTGAAWWILALGGIALILVLIFILQNLTATPASFLVAHWSIPLGLDLLLAALLGGLVTFLLGTARMLQLRRLAKRYAGRRHQH